MTIIVGVIGRVLRRVVFGTVAVAAIAGCGEAADRWLIGGVVCSQQSLNYGDTNISCYPAVWGNVENYDRITVRASAHCETNCSGNSISTSRTLVIGVTRPCQYAVAYRFDAGAQVASVPYVFVRVVATNAIASLVNAVTTIDCDNVVTSTGDTNFTEPC